MGILGQISTKEHYGLRLVSHLVKTYFSHQPVSLADISQKEKISVKYLEQIVHPFRQAGWVKSRRGRSGGYIMIKNPNNLSLKEVIDLLSEDNDTLVQCLKEKCPLGKTCPSKKAWNKVQADLEKSLKQIKLSEL